MKWEKNSKKGQIGIGERPRGREKWTNIEQISWKDE